MHQKTSFYWFVVIVGAVIIIRSSAILLSMVTLHDLANFIDPQSMAPLGTLTLPTKKEIIRPANPIRIIIPSIAIDAPLESVGMTAQGALDVPKTITDAAWFDAGPRPGEKGNAVIDGHYGWRDKIPAVFDNLHNIKKGDRVYVIDEKSMITIFTVRDIRTYKETEKTPEIFTSTDGATHLNLITCQGAWNIAKQSYADRLVVFTEQVKG